MENIRLNAPGPGQADIIQRAKQLRERIESVQSDIQGPPQETVQLDSKSSNERLGAYNYTGAIGSDKFATVGISQRNGKMDALVASGAQAPSAAAGETIKWHLTTSQATGFRAGVATALGAIGGGLGSVASWALATSWNTQATSRTVVGEAAASVLAAVSKPFDFASDVFRAAERKVSDPGTKDQFYGSYKANGEGEQFLFRTDGTLGYEHFDAR
ncbi:unnamed protein product [Phaeothamnion confervicola]